MKQLGLAAVVVTALLLTPVTGLAGGDLGRSGPIIRLPPVEFSINFENVEYQRHHSKNGLVEYAARAEWHQSAAPEDPPRFAYRTGEIFLQERVWELGTGAAGEFRLVASELLDSCLGIERVTFQQFHMGVPIESTGIKFTVVDQEVTRVDARFIKNVSLLPPPSCNVVGEPQYPRYVPRPEIPVGQTNIHVIVEQQVTGEGWQTLFDCAGNELSTVDIIYGR